MATTYMPDFIVSALRMQPLACNLIYIMTIVNFFGAATMCWRAAMDNATWTVVGTIIPTHSTIPYTAAPVNADITNPATITALVQSSALERWVTLALCPLYLVNLGLAAMDACHKAPFFPRQLEYRKV